MSARREHAHVVCFYGIDGEPRMEFHEQFEWLVSIYDPAVSSSLASDQVQSIVGYFRTSGEHLERICDADVDFAIDVANEDDASWVVDDPADRPYTVRMHGPGGFTATTGTYIEPKHAQHNGVDRLPASLAPVIVRRDGQPMDHEDA